VELGSTDLFSRIVGALLAFLYIKSRLPKQTIEEQSKVIAALEKRIETMEFESKDRLKKQIEDGKAIALGANCRL